jgi:hypothetical protein
MGMGGQNVCQDRQDGADGKRGGAWAAVFVFNQRYVGFTNMSSPILLRKRELWKDLNFNAMEGAGVKMG